MKYSEELAQVRKECLVQEINALEHRVGLAEDYAAGKTLEVKPPYTPPAPERHKT